jgi:hypothetical protein
MVEKKILTYLRNNQSVAPFLTTYAGVPAVFLQEAPMDTDNGWQGSQYGRLVFGVDYTEDAERAITASLWVDVYSRADGPDPEEIAPVVQAELNNRFFADGEEVIALAWNATNGFQETRGDKLVNGVTLTFTILYFPSQLTTGPDPVKAINRWTKERLPNSLVIGLDALPDSWTPSENPTIYWRIASIKPGTMYPDTFNCTWHDVDLNGHFMIDDTNTRLTVCKAFIDELTASGAVVMTDDSPMFIMRIAYTAASDAIRTGQLVITASYGVLRTYKDGTVLTNIHTDEILNKG